MEVFAICNKSTSFYLDMLNDGTPYWTQNIIHADKFLDKEWAETIAKRCNGEVVQL